MANFKTVKDCVIDIICKEGDILTLTHRNTDPSVTGMLTPFRYNMDLNKIQSDFL